LGHVVERRADRGQGCTDVEVALLDLSGEISVADPPTVGVAGDLAGDEHQPRPGGHRHLPVAVDLRQAFRVHQGDGHTASSFVGPPTASPVRFSDAGASVPAMSAVDDILSRIPMADLAARLGVDQDTAEQATRQALPALLGGIQANTADPGGAESFASAVQQHDTDLTEGGVDLNQVDENDGDRIVGHVFGEQRGQVVQQLGTTGGPSTSQDLMAKLLPMLAPIVMAWLAKRLTGGAATGPGGASGGGIGDVLGGILGGAAGQGGQQQGGLPGGLGDLLGGLLGGGRRA
jgi:hypothetical protein